MMRTFFYLSLAIVLACVLNSCASPKIQMDNSSFYALGENNNRSASQWKLLPGIAIGNVLPNEFFAQQIMTDLSVVYLQHGVLYLFDPIELTSKPLTIGMNISSFSWSDQYQLFAVAQNGKIQLLDRSGSLQVDVTKKFEGEDSIVNIPLCTGNGSKQAIDILKNAEVVGWVSAQYSLLLSTVTRVGEFCNVVFGYIDLKQGLFREALVVHYFDAPYRFIDEQTIVAEEYSGGGNRRNIIAETSPPFRKSYIESYASFPVESNQSHQWALLQPPNAILQIFSTITQTENLVMSPQIFTMPLPFISKIDEKKNMVWSFDDQLMTLHMSDTKHEDINSFQWKLFPHLLILDVRQGNTIQFSQKFHKFRSTWIPQSHELLLFDENDEALDIYRVKVATKEVDFLQSIHSVQFISEMVWSPNGHFLFFIGNSSNGQDTYYVWDESEQKLSTIQPEETISDLSQNPLIQAIIWSENEERLLLIKSSTTANSTELWFQTVTMIKSVSFK